MTKYLLAQVHHDDPEAEAPSLFVLPLKVTDVTEFLNYLHIAKQVQKVAPHLTALTFQFERGYWMTTGDPAWDEEMTNHGATVQELEDIMAIVGEDVTSPTLILETDGDLSFRCVCDQVDLFLDTSPINLSEIRKAFGV